MAIGSAFELLRTTRVPLIYFIFVCAFALLAFSYLPTNGISLPNITLYQDCNAPPPVPRVVRTVPRNLVLMRRRSPATPVS